VVVVLGILGVVILLCYRQRKRKIASHVSAPVDIDAPTFKPRMGETADSGAVSPFLSMYTQDASNTQMPTTNHKSQSSSASIDSRHDSASHHLSSRVAIPSIVPSSFVLPPPTEGLSALDLSNDHEDDAAVEATNGTDVRRVMSALRAEVNRLRREQELQVFSDNASTFVAPPDYNETIAPAGSNVSPTPSAPTGSRPLPVLADGGSAPLHPLTQFVDKERREAVYDSG
jgi:hypothetical protein